jgi:hypothetical protein
MTAYPDDRLFAINPPVCGEAGILTQAHVKVSDDGGQVAPRIYSHDETVCLLVVGRR